jgi:Photosynthetic reaction centre cytochrome C subunit
MRVLLRNHRTGRFAALALMTWVLITPAGTAQTGPQPAGKNIKELPWGVNTQKIMAGFTAALGVECAYCHVPGDFASDANSKKDVARSMIRMMREANYHFSDVKLHVTCYECHRGEAKPRMAPNP